MATFMAEVVAHIGDKQQYSHWFVHKPFSNAFDFLDNLVFSRMTEWLDRFDRLPIMI